jgi:abhydrolase domain-containing protein 17
MNMHFLKKILVGELSWMRLLRSILFIYACFFLFALFFSNKVLFPVPRSSYKDSEQILKLTTKDGCRIAAVYKINPQAKFTVLYSHGNGEDLGLVRPCLTDLYQMGFSVFAYDYHGYGISEGSPNEGNVYQDIQAAFQYLTQNLKIPASQIIIYGRSVGSGPSVDLASREKVAGLILESPFLSAFRTVTRIPILPFDKFSNLNKIHLVQCPVLVMHGKLDQVIPFSHGNELFRMANEPKWFIPFEKSGHNDLGYLDEDLYRNTISQFQSHMGVLK